MYGSSRRTIFSFTKKPLIWFAYKDWRAVTFEKYELRHQRLCDADSTFITLESIWSHAWIRVRVIGEEITLGQMCWASWPSRCNVNVSIEMPFSMITYYYFSSEKLTAVITQCSDTEGEREGEREREIVLDIRSISFLLVDTIMPLSCDLTGCLNVWDVWPCSYHDTCLEIKSLVDSWKFKCECSQHLLRMHWNLMVQTIFWGDMDYTFNSVCAFPAFVLIEYTLNTCLEKTK